MAIVITMVDTTSTPWKSLQALVRKPEIRDEIKDGHCASAGVLCDFCDGKFLRNHPLINKKDTLLYFDDLETLNPLGSRRG